MWYVYIVECADQTYYTGISTDIPRRIRQHNGELCGGSKYCLSRNPVTLVYQEEQETRSEASRRERQIKRLTRREKQLLIRSLS